MLNTIISSVRFSFIFTHYFFALFAILHAITVWKLRLIIFLPVCLSIQYESSKMLFFSFSLSH